MLCREQPSSASLGRGRSQVPSRRETWLTDPGHLSVRCVSMREGNCLEQISGLASEASYALIVAKLPHHFTFTMNKIFSLIYIWGIYISSFSETPKRSSKEFWSWGWGGKAHKGKAFQRISLKIVEIWAYSWISFSISNPRSHSATYQLWDLEKVYFVSIMGIMLHYIYFHTLWGLNGITHVKCLTQFLAHSRGSVCFSNFFMQLLDCCSLI